MRQQTELRTELQTDTDTYTQAQEHIHTITNGACSPDEQTHEQQWNDGVPRSPFVQNAVRMLDRNVDMMADQEVLVRKPADVVDRGVGLIVARVLLWCTSAHVCERVGVALQVIRDC